MCSRVALTALKTEKMVPDNNNASVGNKAGGGKALEDMEAEADNTMNAGNGEVCM